MAELAETYGDMVCHMKAITETGMEISASEEELMATAYKDAVEYCRSSWSAVLSIEQRLDGQSKEMAKEYRKTLEKELLLFTAFWLLI